MSVNPRLGSTPVTSSPQPGANPGGPREGVAVALFGLLTVAAVGAVLYATDEHFANDPAARAARGEVAGVVKQSLLEPRNLARAISKVRGRAPSSSVVHARFAPARVDLQMRDPDGRVTIYHVDPSFSISTDSFGDELQKGFPLSAIQTAAPQRIFRAVSRRAKARPKDLDYLVFDEGSGSERYHWGMYLTDDVPIARRQWSADASGRDVRPLGTPPLKERRAQARNARFQRCLSGAATGPAVQRCYKRLGPR